VVDYYTKAPKYCTATYAAPGYTTKAPEYYIINKPCLSLIHPIYTTTSEAAKYYYSAPSIS
jgi:hypothetical protein